ncbi:hypothetical protein D3C86_2238960 [compost metagenome]
MAEDDVVEDVRLDAHGREQRRGRDHAVGEYRDAGFGGGEIGTDHHDDLEAAEFGEYRHDVDARIGTSR